jgi:predicted adenylyl cyclase CyaB
MAIEYEYYFFDFSKKDIIKKIKSLKGKCKGTFLFRVQVFIHPLEKPGTYIRVRDEGHRITMTYKYKSPESKFDEENEIIINNFDEAVTILLGIGCKKKYYYEKIREIWTVKNTEIVFDSNPGIDDRMEIESKTKSELMEMVKYFEVKPSEIKDRYIHLFELIIPKSSDLTFKNVKKDLLPHVKKNKQGFIELVDNQVEKYNKLLKKIKK